MNILTHDHFHQWLEIYGRARAENNPPVNDNLGIALWQSIFTVIESERRFTLDCLFVVEFDGEWQPSDVGTTHRARRNAIFGCLYQAECGT